ncbi:hypothetical protein [Halopelagius fulvigenes]|uniref:Uncharacterized protein n=1 Tax=Halopelagius fulvigenes TaxID=1198324 RepID=A0ABD5TXH7_9EURY
MPDQILFTNKPSLFIHEKYNLNLEQMMKKIENRGIKGYIRNKWINLYTNIVCATHFLNDYSDGFPDYRYRIRSVRGCGS